MADWDHRARPCHSWTQSYQLTATLQPTHKTHCHLPNLQTLHLFWTYTCNRVGMGWNSPCLWKEMQNRIVLSVYTRISQECGTKKKEVIKVSEILALPSLFRHILNAIGNTEDKSRHVVEQREGAKVLVSDKEQWWQCSNGASCVAVLMNFLLPQTLMYVTNWQYNIFENPCHHSLHFLGKA